MRLFTVLALLIAIAIVLFALQNSVIVTVSFLSFKHSGSLALILVLLFTLGLLAGILVSIPRLIQKSSTLREQKKKIKQLEESLARAAVSNPTGQNKTFKQ
jgi:lipopolysaccharide assembly protein A